LLVKKQQFDNILTTKIDQKVLNYQNFITTAFINNIIASINTILTFYWRLYFFEGYEY
jgi:hypothetical protein